MKKQDPSRQYLEDPPSPYVPCDPLSYEPGDLLPYEPSQTHGRRILGTSRHVAKHIKSALKTISRATKWVLRPNRASL